MLYVSNIKNIRDTHSTNSESQSGIFSIEQTRNRHSNKKIMNKREKVLLFKKHAIKRFISLLHKHIADPDTSTSKQSRLFFMSSTYYLNSTLMSNSILHYLRDSKLSVHTVKKFKYLFNHIQQNRRRYALQQSKKQYFIIRSYYHYPKRFFYKPGNVHNSKNDTDNNTHIQDMEHDQNSDLILDKYIDMNTSAVDSRNEHNNKYIKNKKYSNNKHGNTTKTERNNSDYIVKRNDANVYKSSIHKINRNADTRRQKNIIGNNNYNNRRNLHVIVRYLNRKIQFPKDKNDILNLTNNKTELKNWLTFFSRFFGTSKSLLTDYAKAVSSKQNTIRATENETHNIRKKHYRSNHNNNVLISNKSLLNFYERSIIEINKIAFLGRHVLLSRINNTLQQIKTSDTYIDSIFAESYSNYVNTQYSITNSRLYPSLNYYGMNNYSELLNDYTANTFTGIESELSFFNKR